MKTENTALGDGPGFLAISRQICDISGTAEIGTAKKQKPGTTEINIDVLYYRRRRFRRILDILPRTAKIGTALKRKTENRPKTYRCIAILHRLSPPKEVVTR